jgi:hypothetical protein
MSRLSARRRLVGNFRIAVEVYQSASAALVAAGIVPAAFNVGQNDDLLVTFSPFIGGGFEAVDDRRGTPE